MAEKPVKFKYFFRVKCINMDADSREVNLEIQSRPIRSLADIEGIERTISRLMSKESFTKVETISWQRFEEPLPTTEEMTHPSQLFNDKPQ